MTLSAILLILVLMAVVLGAVLTLVSAVVRGDGLNGPGRRTEPPRSHYPDVFETAVHRSL